MGDEFGLTEAQKTSCQHYATIDGEYITAFDNGNAHKATRIVSYKVDQQNKNLLAFKEFACGGKFSIACGCVQHISDELYMIGWGAATTDAQCMSVNNFATGEGRMTVTLANANNITYRCAYYE